MIFLALLAAVGAMVGNTIAALWEARGSRLARYGRPIWLQPWFLAGLLADVIAWGLTVIALQLLPVFAVQGILAGAIALTTLADNGWDPYNLVRRERVGVLAVLAGLVLVAASAAPDRPEQTPAVVTPVLLVAFALLLVVTPFVWRSGRPMLQAFLAGLAFGGTVLAVRAVHVGPPTRETAVALLTDPLIYGIVVMGVLGVFAFARALRDGRVGSCTAVLTVTEVVVPGIVGLALLGDRIRPGWELSAGLGLLFALVGVLMLTRSDPDSERAAPSQRRSGSSVGIPALRPQGPTRGPAGATTMTSDPATSHPATSHPATSDGDDPRTSWQRWRDERAAWIREPHGWLSLTALHWLDERPSSIPGLPGTWRVRDADTVEIAGVTAADDVRLPGSDRAVEGTATVRPQDGQPGVMVEVGERVVELARRTDDHVLRVRDPHASTRTGFSGIPTWPFDERWVRPGRFTPYAEPRPITVDAVVDGVHHYPTALGTVEFDVDGTPQTLVALPGRTGGLLLHFRDATSGRSSYGGGRSVELADPGPDGAVTVDLNRTKNLPCAFTDYATCPLPPAGNAVTVAVEAGEKDPARVDAGRDEPSRR